MNWAGHILWILFGPGTWGSGGNMVAWVICGVIAGAWVRAKLHAHHVAALAQAARHHFERLTQAEDHHKALKTLAETHHQQLLDRADTHHEALKAHITAQKPAARRRASG